MNLKLLVISFSFLTGFTGFSQSAIGVIDETVLQMKNKVDSFQELEDINTDEQKRSIFYLNDIPVLISIYENGKIEKNVAWYYKNKKLIYTETNWIDSDSGKKLFQEKTYHQENTMIAWMKTENTFVDATSSEFKKMDKELTTYGKKIFLEAMKD